MIGHVNRRAFLAGLGAGGLALGFLPTSASGEGPRDLSASPLLSISEAGIVSIVCARSEMGQGVRSSIPVLIADELGADPARVVVTQADGDAKYGDQNTDGSTSIRKLFDELRQIGAVARELLVAAAAAQWRVEPAACTTKNNLVTHVATGRTAEFGSLVRAAAKRPVPKKAEVRPWDELTRVNAPDLPLLDGQALVDGTATFGADVKLEGMAVAVIARPPVVGGKVARFDGAAALAVPGVLKVFEIPAPKPPWGFQQWGGIVVVAADTWSALRGRAALDITWDDGENASYDSTSYRDTLLAAVRAPGKDARSVGDVDAALASAAQIVEAEYVVPHLGQLPMEPPVAIARVIGDTCEIWAATQDPQTAREEAAKALGVTEADVAIHVTLLGGGFGRKSKADFICEAALVAKEAGIPVRLQWTREDDVRHGYYNAVNAQRLRAGLDAGGRVVAWHQRTAFPLITSTFGVPDWLTVGHLQQGMLDLALDVPNIRMESCRAEAHVRIGWYRSVYNIFHAFSAGSFVDEIAHARQADPRDVLLEIIGRRRLVSLEELGVANLKNYGESLEHHPVDAGRLRSVVERVTEMSKWTSRKADGRSLGVAAHRSFASYAAAVVSVVHDAAGRVRIDEAWVSLDAGRVVNQDRVRSQLEGAVVMGISNAMFGGITMKGGRTEQSNFNDARIARIGDVPRKIHVDFVPSDLPPGGVGEPGVPPVAPALANAIFALTGQRLREMPFARARLAVTSNNSRP